jgi:hypothetical protein
MTDIHILSLRNNAKLVLLGMSQKKISFINKDTFIHNGQYKLIAWKKTALSDIHPNIFRKKTRG